MILPRIEFVKLVDVTGCFFLPKELGIVFTFSLNASLPAKGGRKRSKRVLP